MEGFIVILAVLLFIGFALTFNDDDSGPHMT